MNPKYSRMWLGAFIVLVFAAGLAMGVVVTRRPGLLDGPGPFGRGMRDRAFEGRQPGRMIGRLARELELTDTQRRELEQVLADRRDRLQSFHRQVRTDFEREQRELREAIRGILTEEQKARFDKMFPERWLMRRGPP